jgi:hypothetical protein
MTTLAELTKKWRDEADSAHTVGRIQLSLQHADELATALEALAESWLAEAGPGLSADGKVDEPAVAVQWCAAQLVKGVR